MKRLVLLALAIAGTTLPAMAHAFLQKASPSAGENLHTSPARVELHFSEALEPATETFKPVAGFEERKMRVTPD